MPPSHLSLLSLYYIKNKKDKNKHTIFNEIILKCHKKIKTTAQNGGLCMFFEIPYFIIGKPLYNVSDCVEYIVDAMKKNGFFVSILSPPNTNILYISWKPAEIGNHKLLK